MLMTFILTTVSLSMFFMFNHPFPLVLTLILQTLVLILGMYTFTETPWMSFITFLIYLGGLLIIFVYLSALIPNEIIFVNKYFLMITMYSGIIVLNSEKIFKPSIEMASIFVYNHSMSSVNFFLLYIMMMLCMLMYLCSLIKSPLKQENY